MTTLLQEWVTNQAEKQPDAIALVAGDERVTYLEMEERSNQLARILRDAGCKRADRICFLIPKSPAAIITMLGILKADCIHVPLDTSSPAPRLIKIIESSDPRFIIAAGKFATVLDEVMSHDRLRDSIRIGRIDSEDPQRENFKAEFSINDVDCYSTAHVDCANKRDDPAHILFTSGSTGAPKGVVITHSNVIHYVEWANKYFGVVSSDRIPGHPPLHFDLSTPGVFGTLAAGAQLHLVPGELNLLPHRLADFIRTSELTEWLSVPSVLHNMARFDVVGYNDFPSLKRVMWCGEVFPTAPLIYWMKRLPNVRFTNLYGPTESTVASSYYTIPKCPEDENAVIPIGTPCEGEELLVLDDDLQPVLPGQEGNLFIGGVGLSAGYWRDKEKTDSAFLPDPRPSKPSDRIYKTGDLAKIGEDGLGYFLGRADSQIKCRGYRIELGEIEAAMKAIDAVGECAVVAMNTDGFAGSIICCAYVPRAGADVSEMYIRERLAGLLPSYMLPQRWLALEKLPQNSNGKTDRRALINEFQSGDIQTGRKLERVLSAEG